MQAQPRAGLVIHKLPRASASLAAHPKAPPARGPCLTMRCRYKRLVCDVPRGITGAESDATHQPKGRSQFNSSEPGETRPSLHEDRAPLGPVKLPMRRDLKSAAAGTTRADHL